MKINKKKFFLRFSSSIQLCVLFLTNWLFRKTISDYLSSNNEVVDARLAALKGPSGRPILASDAEKRRSSFFSCLVNDLVFVMQSRNLTWSLARVLHMHI